MNYNAKMLESKIFNFLKQLICDLILTVCILLIVAVVIVHFSSCAIYDVFSDSQTPEIYAGDLIFVKPQENYNVGDVITFQQKDVPITITHRIMSIKENKGEKFYICHGDNVESVTRFLTKDTALPYYINWKIDSAYLDSLSLEQLLNQGEDVIQIVQIEEIKGKVVCSIKKLGCFFRFVTNHYITLVVLVVDVWICLSFVENWLQIKKKFRLKNKKV